MIDTRGKICAALYAEIERQGEGLKQKDNYWVATNEVKVQGIIDAFDPLPDEIAAKQQLIKSEANLRILASHPTHQQINTITDAVDLILRHVSGDLSLGELSSRLVSIHNTWREIQDIRSASDLAESEVSKKSSLQGVELFNPKGSW